MNTEQQVLTNDERAYFGLDRIRPDWERIAIQPDFSVYFDRNVIRKTVALRRPQGEGYENFIEYIESDCEIRTRDRQFVFPLAVKCKAKKLTFSSVSSIKPTGCVFRMNLVRPDGPSALHVSNSRNSISLPIAFPGNLHTLEQFRQWLADFIAACPSGYFEKVDRMRTLAIRRVKYYNGDIFRFEIGLEYYGFGLIIGQTRIMKTDRLLPKEHIMHFALGPPILVRLYMIKTKDKHMSPEKIITHPLGKTFLMTEKPIIWGTYGIVGVKKLIAEDISFPVQAGVSLNRSPCVRLCWGLGMVVKQGVRGVPEQIESNRLLRNIIHFEAGDIYLEPMMSVAQTDAASNELEQIAFKYFKVPSNITFDEFARRYGGMTTAEYAEYANKSVRPKQLMSLLVDMEE
jgi:hypothetical protein